MKNLKSIIIILSIIIIVVIILMVYFMHQQKSTTIDEQGDIEESKYVEGSYELNHTIEEIESEQEYVIVKYILQEIQVYINYLNYDLSGTRIQFSNENEEKDFLNKYIKQGTDIIKNNIMPKEYVEKFNITDEKIYKELAKYANKDIKINDIYVCENSINIKTYIVYSESLDTKEKFNIALVIDSNNNSFYMMLEDYINDMDINKREDLIGKSIEQNIENIEKNEYNTFNVPSNISQAYISEIFNDYKEYLNNDIEKAYNMLYDEYKQKRFNSIDEFEQYIKSRAEEFSDMELSKYKIDVYEKYNEYICLNQYGDYFIFLETNPIKGNVILDTYTIDLPEFIEKYNKENEQVKVGMNIEKIISALNTKDYKYIYDKLDNSFKNNKFTTYQEFEKYAKSNFFDKNKVEYKKFSNEAGIFIYELKLKTLEDSKENAKDMTIIMKLLEGTDFVMSFNIE